MIAVTLSYRSGALKEVLLAGVPRVGEQIRLKDTPEAHALMVEHVLWLEGGNGGLEPSVIVVVRPSDR